MSAVTVDHSYELLCDEGYIESRPRSGYYVIYRGDDGFAGTGDETGAAEAGLREPEPDDGEGDGGGVSPFPFSTLAKTMRRVITEQGEEILEKSPNTGREELRLAVSRYLQRSRGIHALPGQIVIGSGAEYLYGMVVEMLGKDRVYGIESPSYEKIEQVYRAKGVRCELLTLGRDGIRSAELKRTKASVLHITPYRSFPSGVTASASKRTEYLRWASSGDRYIVEDDFESEYSMLRKHEETVYSRASAGNVIYINTFTRTISPALRLGYMVLPPELLPVFDRTVGFYSCTVPAFEQMVLERLLNEGDFERHINRIRREKRRK